MNITLAHPTSAAFAIANWLHSRWADPSQGTEAPAIRKGAELTFTRNQIRAMENPQGLTIECLQGHVWITLDGDPRDIILAAGELFTVDLDQRILVMGLDEARVRCSHPFVA